MSEMGDMANDAELASMDSDGLRRLVLAQRVEINDLKSRLVDLEALACETGRAGTPCPTCRLRNKGASEIALSDRETEPIFPSELFLMISEYLEPGTRTLANLAQSCSGLYRILLPRLYYSIDLKRLLGKLDAAMDIKPEINSRVLGCGLVKVAELDVFLDREWMIERQARIVNSCSGLKHLICSWSMIDSYAFDGCDFPETLETLEVYGDQVSWREGWRKREDASLYDNPNFRKLKLKGMPNYRAFEIFASSLPPQATIDLDFTELRRDTWDWEPDRLPGALLRKIRRWKFYSYDEHVQLFRSCPSLAPESIAFAWDENGAFEEEEWTTLVALPFLKVLEFEMIDSRVLLGGLPENLEEFRVEAFTLNLRDQSEVDTIAGLLSSVRDRVRFGLKCTGYDHPAMFSSELRIWQAVEGFESVVTADEAQGVFG